MQAMFLGATSFNVNLSSWDVSNVVSTAGMFRDATSMTHQLAGAWGLRRGPGRFVVNFNMFLNCPGSIAGLRKSTDGTPFSVE